MGKPYYVVKIDAQGNTARTQAKEKMDLETQLAIEYLIYKNFDFAALVTNSAQTRKIQGVKNRLGGGNTKPKGNAGVSPKRPVKIEGDFDSLVGAKKG